MATPPLVKKLSLREVARRFEQGDDSALEDYRVKNLNEVSVQSSAALQQTLRTMPKARSVIQDLLRVTQVWITCPASPPASIAPPKTGLPPFISRARALCYRG